MLLASQLGLPLGAAEPTTDQLRRIANLLSEDDATGLRGYLQMHPELLVEDTALSGLLRDFMAEPAVSTQRGIDPSLRNALGNLDSQDSATTDSGSASAAPSLY